MPDTAPKNISIEKIMAEIKGTAATMSSSHLPVSHELGAFNAERLFHLQTELRGYVHTLIRTKDCTAIKPVLSDRRGILRPIDIFVKRIVRKLTLWLIEPAWQQQKIYNNALTASISRIAEANEELMRGVIYLSKQLDETGK